MISGFSFLHKKRPVRWTDKAFDQGVAVFYLNPGAAKLQPE